MNFLIESYSLHDVHFKELYSQAAKPLKSQSYFSQEDKSVRRRKTVRVLVYTGIAASLLAVVILIPVRTGFLNYSDLRLFRSKGELRTDKLPEKEISITETIQKTAPTTYKIEIKPAEFHIIAGSFREFGNARMLMKKLEDQGLTARILNSGSEYFRVSAGSYPNQEDASLALSAIRELPGMDTAWLLKD
jgi:hypothetical protein